MALLTLAAAWTRRNRRNLVCLTVDHGVQPESAAWTRFAGDAARRAGADWRRLEWRGPKPDHGLPAAAREARHRLIAEAARDAGAKVVLFAHTLDDRIEAEAMRDEGSPLGRMREWSPSPAWPEGREVFLLRPLLEVSRRALRALLMERGQGWIEDAANDDLKFHRARVRARAELAPPPALEQRPGFRPRAKGVEVDEAGVVAAPRELANATGAAGFVAAALLSASGTKRPPRGERLARLMDRLRGSESFAATLCGARIEAGPEKVRFMRDAGERARGGLRPLELEPGRVSVWDGRFEIESLAAGEVRPLGGLAAKLSREDRVRLSAVPPRARPSLPVFVRKGFPSLGLASAASEARCLVEGRLFAACGEIAHERDVARGARGAEVAAFLC
jgi:tRNA(Ile)-lysidine synthase